MANANIISGMINKIIYLILVSSIKCKIIEINIRTTITPIAIFLTNNEAPKDCIVATITIIIHPNINRKVL